MKSQELSQIVKKWHPDAIFFSIDFHDGIPLSVDDSCRGAHIEFFSLSENLKSIATHARSRDPFTNPLSHNKPEGFQSSNATHGKNTSGSHFSHQWLQRRSILFLL
jgi:hypothetical protein